MCSTCRAVCIWPITKNAVQLSNLDNPDLSNPTVTAVDDGVCTKVIAFDATVGGHRVANAGAKGSRSMGQRYDPFSHDGTILQTARTIQNL